MFKRKVDSNYQEHEFVELSRRGFFGRLAMGAALTLGGASLAEAAKPVSKHHKAAPVKSAVRLPKQQPRLTKLQHHRAIASVSAKKHAPQTHPVSHKYVARHGKHYYSGGREHSILQTHLQKPWLAPNPDTDRFAASAGFPTYRALAFKNPHTGDSLNLTYFEKGEYLRDALDEISYLLRDYHNGEVHAIDTELLDQLHDLKQMLDLKQPFHVICGYRSPTTNAQLHAEQAGVASNSFHMYGRAVDIRLERFDLRRAHNAAVAMHRGGVGYYPSANFLHLDSGSFRSWSL